MGVYVGKYPVFVSHTKEVEKLLCFTADLQGRLQARGEDKGEEYECLLRVRMKCRDLLLKLYAEESDIMLMDEHDRYWIGKIVHFVQTVILGDQQKAV